MKLLQAYCEYALPSFPELLGKNKVPYIYCTERKKLSYSKMFIIYLLEIESSRKAVRNEAVRTLKYRLLNQPITEHQ